MSYHVFLYSNESLFIQHTSATPETPKAGPQPSQMLVPQPVDNHEVQSSHSQQPLGNHPETTRLTTDSVKVFTSSTNKSKAEHLRLGVL